MNTRVLIIIAVIIAVIAGWFFRKQGDITPPVNIQTSEVDYEATDIQAIQTNEKGETEYELNADSLTHNPATNLDEMSGITMNWEPSDEQRYVIEAGSATMNQQTGDLQLFDGFSLVSENKTDDTSDSEPIKVTGQALKGNTKSRQVYSEEPVQVEQGMNRFQAATMTANLETGDYEFGEVAVTFTPAERQDKALF
ncbi:LPS export ABC transporter periplasmic protein LptC [Psychrobacter sp. F1192]|uniref:LPS export ABC transporter periplasmic protein LptC n=1 Tax=Psychrobacter coccoides TaxID=2818440 RepID=A0ABS3NLB4_9GAMM|nr:LPS export ABC transporter periplasmic protein LptC [Psychrobacter coccoides]